MKKRLLLISLLIFTGLLLAEMTYAQKVHYNNRYGKNLSTFKGKKYDFKKRRYNSYGFSLNAFNYFGDLAPLPNAVSTDISFTRPGFGIMWNHRYGPYYTFRTSFTWGRLKADDFSSDPTAENGYHRYVRNVHFRNDIKELALVGLFDLMPNDGTYRRRVNWTPYLFGGLAVFHHNPKALAPDLDKNGNPLAEAGTWVSLSDLGTEGQNVDTLGIGNYKKIQIAIPLGIGVRIRLPDNFNFSFEIGYRHTFTDYIDDVSRSYVDLGLLDSELARALSDRSMEATGAVSGQARDLALIDAAQGTTTYNSGGAAYTVYRGFGQGRPAEGSDPGNIRGNKSDNDIYIVTSFQISYILGTGAAGRAKFR